MAVAAAILVTVGIGFLIESLGSYVEYYWIDRRHPDKEKMLCEWWSYLRTMWPTEPVGQHYLRRILVVFKFELNLFVSLLLALPSLLWLGLAGYVTGWPLAALAAGVVVAAVYLCHAATESSLLLARIRRALVEASQTAQGAVPNAPPAPPRAADAIASGRG